MDKIYRCMLNKGKIRIFLADTSLTCTQICDKHNYDNFVCCDALSRVISVTAIMGIMQKFGKLRVTVESNGPIKGIAVDSDSEANVRGYVYNSNIDKSLSYEKAIGDLGLLTVVKDFGMNRSFSGSVELENGQIGTDFSKYFVESEQVPSFVSVGTSIENGKLYSGALIVQLMPGYKDEDLLYVENFSKNCPKIIDIVKFDNKNDVLEELFPEIEILSTHDINFKCSCSKERFISTLATIERNELVDMIEKNEPIEIKCQFCSEKYVLSSDDIKESLKIKDSKETKQC